MHAFIEFILDNEQEIAEAGAVRAADRRAAHEGEGRPGGSELRLSVRAEAAPARLQSGRVRYGELLVKGLLGLCALISVATTVGIIAALFIPAFEFFQDVSIVDFLTGTEWAPLFEPALFGVVPLVVGTLSVTFWAVLVAIPFGLGSAIYLSEYAGPRTRKILKPMLELLAGIPTIVYGYFALTFFTPLLRDLGIGVDIFNALSAGPGDGRDDPADRRVALGGRDVRRAARPSRRGVRARRDPARGGDPHRGAGGGLRDHRLVRARVSRARSARR